MNEISSGVMRFIFANHGVRGEIVQLTEPCKALMHDSYPKCLNLLLCELAVSAVLVAATLKDGSEIMIQLKGGKNAPLKYALINIRADLSFYGSASLNANVSCDDNTSFADLVGSDGIMSLTVFPKEGTKWQGIIQLNPKSLGDSLEDYFKESQQLPSKFIIRADIGKASAGGLMLQIIPEIKDNLNSLDHLGILSDTLTTDEMLTLEKEEILSRLFAEEKVKIFKEQPVSFKCICSKERCQQALMSLSPKEISSLIADGQAEMTCQHCGKHYVFSKDELTGMLAKLRQ